MGRIIKGRDVACIYWYSYTDCTHRTKSIMKNLTKEQQKELEMLAAEIEAEAIQMKLDYKDNPSEMSGSVVVVHEDADILNEEEHSSADRFGTEWEEKHSLEDEEE